MAPDLSGLAAALPAHLDPNSVEVRTGLAVIEVLTPLAQWFSRYGDEALFLVLMVVGLCSGTVIQWLHYRSLRRREANTHQLPVLSLGLEAFIAPAQWHTIERVQLVGTSVVVSQDYFQGFWAWLKSLVGGRLTAYEHLMERTRREAVLRLKAQCPQACAVVHLHFETLGLGEHQPNALRKIVVLAYGTAVVLKSATSQKETALKKHHLGYSR